MLEARILLIQRSGPTHSVVTAPTGRPLGFARWRPQAGGVWRHWFSRRLLEVHEADDEPLVFTVRQHWFLRSKWDVFDADGNQVGSIHGRLLGGRFGQVLALCEIASDGATVVFRTYQRRDLATLVQAGADRRLTFAEEVQDDPFAKMVLLAATLLVVSRLR
jgi:hypothetical protein